MHTPPPNAPRSLLYKLYPSKDTISFVTFSFSQVSQTNKISKLCCRHIVLILCKCAKRDRALRHPIYKQSHIFILDIAEKGQNKNRNKEMLILKKQSVRKKKDKLGYASIAPTVYYYNFNIIMKQLLKLTQNKVILCLHTFLERKSK